MKKSALKWLQPTLLLLNVSIFMIVSARKEITFIQVLSANKFYVPSYHDFNNSTAFEPRTDLKYEYLLKHAFDIPNSGKMHLFTLGTYLRETYDTFLGGLYFDELMKMHTSEFAVSIIAGELINAGLWPPINQQIWKEELAWQPIPFEYLPIAEDQILLGTLCPNFKYETEAVLKMYSNLSEEQQNILNDINREAELDLKNPLDATLFYLAVENSLESNKSLPEWLNKIYPSDAFKSLATQAYDLLSKSTLQKRLNGALFFTQLVQECRKHMGKGSSGTAKMTAKMNVYSGDDRNLAGLLNSLNLSMYDVPKAGAALIFELYREDEQFFIKSNYYLGAGQETVNLVLSGCQMFCPIEQFIDMLKEIILSEKEISQLCGNSALTAKGSSEKLHPTGHILHLLVLTYLVLTWLYLARDFSSILR